MKPTSTRAARYVATAALTDLRIRKGLSQVEFGQLSGMGQAGVSKMEGGQRVIRLGVARRVAAALGLTLEQCLRRKVLAVVGNEEAGDEPRGEATG